MPALDNGIMPVERWKEACEAASCQANYRKSKGLTETCDDYFVDGVQWADEHPINAKEVDLNKEIERFVKSDEFQKASGTIKVTNLLAKHFFELGLSASNPITAADRGTAEEIIINLKRVEKDYRIDLTMEIEWLRNKVKNGEV